MFRDNDSPCSTPSLARVPHNRKDRKSRSHIAEQSNPASLPAAWLPPVPGRAGPLRRLQQSSQSPRLCLSNCSENVVGVLLRQFCQDASNPILSVQSRGTFASGARQQHDPQIGVGSDRCPRRPDSGENRFASSFSVALSKIGLNTAPQTSKSARLRSSKSTPRCTLPGFAAKASN